MNPISQIGQTRFWFPQESLNTVPLNFKVKTPYLVKQMRSIFRQNRVLFEIWYRMLDFSELLRVVPHFHVKMSTMLQILMIIITKLGIPLRNLIFWEGVIFTSWVPGGGDGVLIRILGLFENAQCWINKSYMWIHFKGNTQSFKCPRADEDQVGVSNLVNQNLKLY